jgi:hypothetical protein
MKDSEAEMEDIIVENLIQAILHLALHVTAK